MTATGILQLENRRLLTKLLVVATAMFGFGFALVPFYETICQITGIRNILQPDHAAISNTQVDTSRNVTVEFDSNTHKMAWGFKPVSPSLELHPGEIQQMVYEIRNDSERAITGQAIPSYSPALAAQHFRKIECFCFTQQTLQAGEVRRMPVTFVVDPDLPRSVGTITLSFTFFEVNGGGARERVGG